MGKSGLIKEAKRHGGYVTPGMVAHHLGHCVDGTVEFLVERDITPGIQNVRRAYAAMLGGPVDVRGPERLRAYETRRLLGDLGDIVAVSARPKGFSATYRRWKDVVGKDVLTNSEVTYLGHRLGEVLGEGHARSKLTKDEALDLFIHVEWRVKKFGGYDLTPEQVEKGRVWLGRRDVHKDIRRDNPHSGDRLVEIASTVHDFKFVGFAKVNVGTLYYPRTGYKPMYKAISEAGSFVYRASPWVDGSGTRLEIY